MKDQREKRETIVSMKVDVFAGSIDQLRIDCFLSFWCNTKFRRSNQPLKFQ